jgi:hypothetical protein
LGLYFTFSFSCRRYKEKKEEVTEPEADPERDQRTVFAYQVIKYIFHRPYICTLALNFLSIIFPMRSDLFSWH